MNLVSHAQSVIRGAWRRRFLMAVPLLIVLPLAIVAALLWPTKYATSSLILLQEYNGLSGETPPYALAQDMRDKIKSLEALASSEFILRRILKKYGPDGSTKEPTAQDIEEYRKRLTVEQAGTQFVMFTLKGGERDGLARELSSILAALFESLLNANSTSLNATSFVMSTRRQDLADLEQQLRSIPPSAGVDPGAALEAKRQDLQTITQRTDQLSEAVKRSRLALDKSLTASEPALALARQPIDTIVTTLRNTLAGLRNDPSINISRATKTRMTSVDSLLGSATKLQADMSELASLAATRQQLQAELDRLGNVTSQRQQLQREAETIRARYGQLALRGNAPTAAADIQLLRAPAQIQVIDTPKDPKQPLSSKLRIAIAGLVAALALSLAFGVIAEQLDGSLRSPGMLRAATGVPVIARFTSLGAPVPRGPDLIGRS